MSAERVEVFGGRGDVSQGKRQFWTRNARNTVRSGGGEGCQGKASVCCDACSPGGGWGESAAQAQAEVTEGLEGTEARTS